MAATKVEDEAPPPPPKSPNMLSPRPRAPSQRSFWGKAREASWSSWSQLTIAADGLVRKSSYGSQDRVMIDFSPQSLEEECDKTARIIRAMSGGGRKNTESIGPILPEALSACQGLAIFTMVRPGFVDSGSGGSGIIISRLPEGSWSSPSGILVQPGSFPFASGVNVYDVVLLLRTMPAVRSFSRPHVILGSDEWLIGQGPISSGSTDTSIESSPTMPIWSYIRSEHNYCNSSINGTTIIERKIENERAYGPFVSGLDILDGDIPPPGWSSWKCLLNVILAASGETHLASLLPTEQSPAQSAPEARRLPPEALDDDDLAARKEMEEAMRSFGIEDPSINDLLRKEDPLLVRTDEATAILGSRGGKEPVPAYDIPLPASPSLSEASLIRNTVSEPVREQMLGDSILLTEVIDEPPSEHSSFTPVVSPLVGESRKSIEGAAKRRSVPAVPPRSSARTPKLGSPAVPSVEDNLQQDVGPPPLSNSSIEGGLADVDLNTPRLPEIGRMGEVV